MPRVVGVDIPSNKPTWISLTYLYGIGRHQSKRILEACGIDGQKRAQDLTEEEVAKIAAEIEKNHVVEGQLKRQIQANIQRLKDIACYRGIRHRRGLPVRGQRTRTNARTRKGPRKTVAGKRSVKEMR
jgi:small subunit ribosomal protein S13